MNRVTPDFLKSTRVIQTLDMSEQEQNVVEEHSSDSEEQRELTEQENEHAMVRYSVGSAEENVNALLIVSVLLVAVQNFLFFAVGDWRYGVASTLPYYTLWTLAALGHQHLHRTKRLYDRAMLCAELSVCSLFACHIRALYTLLEGLAYDETIQRYTIVHSTWPFAIWFTAVLAAACSLLMMALTAFIIAQYRVLKRDYPRCVELDAAVKATKSQ